jgi:hypothetical protein
MGKLRRGARGGEAKREGDGSAKKEWLWRLDCYSLLYTDAACLTLHSASPFVLIAACLAGVVVVSLARRMNPESCATANRILYALLLCLPPSLQPPSYRAIHRYICKHDSFLPCVFHVVADSHATIA